MTARRQFASASTREDARTAALNKVKADLANGTRPWMKPWDAGHLEGRAALPVRHNGIPYRGINVLMLFMAAATAGFGSNKWVTFKQTQELGGHVKKGEHGAPVFYTNTIHKTEQNNDGQDVERDLRFLKSYTVFNTEQTEGLPAEYYATPEPKFKNDIERLEHVEMFVANTGAVFKFGGGRAFYRPSLDYIQMPPVESFRDQFAFHSTQLHELSHWTRHETRLNRSFDQKRFGDEGYQWEELTAELSSVFLCADLAIVPEPPEENAAYISSWLKGLNDHPHALFTAASHAQKAADHLHGYQPHALVPTEEPAP